jgi:hypothetical protein
MDALESFVADHMFKEGIIPGLQILHLEKSPIDMIDQPIPERQTGEAENEKLIENITDDYTFESNI